MRDEVQQAINSLKKLNLSKYPSDEIHNLIDNVGVVGLLGVTIHPRESIYRARLNEANDHFNSKCQLTYKPQQFNKTYQRASTPNMTMFYGSYLPQGIEENDLKETRVVPSYEAVPWLRDKTTKGQRLITYTRWIVTQEINLIAILQHDKYYDNSLYTKKLMTDFNSFLNQNADKKNETIAFTTFLANEFAKEVDENDYEYIISAEYTKRLVSKGFDGVLYPSVRLNGAGFNIALTPQAADTKLQLVVVIECSAYKYYEKTVLDNDFQAILYPHQTNFELQKIANNNHAGVDICLKHLGLKSINEIR